ncbi:hypothetical protein PPERSA_01281 [Pseudocohnilembus persalinus]|uniref:Methyltransferase domain-containing protein n=1 Tax=Pseudocohnilembus persalinus TaxID=266149 RepID=A0A0V0QGN4_PSEPJ|nr:hypothetical protein PPERSA_01281 [Pseudocohnilembus persalinus]|eukprot:KRX01378.1 hypothetical protein PPERSA_01281 [Pseudocohnilembus persalinus]
MQQTKNNIKQDLFGFNDQGINYDQARPVYPSKFIQQIQDSIPQKQKTNYLDIATGTGQLLFQIAPKFQGKQIIGNDISEKQLSIAQEKADKYNKNTEKKINLILCDFQQIPQKLSEKNLTEKFDLITIGQALHWLDVDKFLQICKNDLLKKDGRLVVLGYIAQGFEFNTKNQNFNKEGLKHYEKYYNTVGPYFDFNRDELTQGYKGFDEKYCFSKYFKNIKFQDEIQFLPGPLDKYIQYCKTFSAYGTYKSKFQENSDFIDPAEVLAQETRSELDQYYKNQNNQENQNQNELLYKNYFFYYILDNNIE